MSKNILVIHASPRIGGNSDILCDRLIDGATTAGHSCEKIALHGKKIGYCIACDACRKNGGTCAIRDDMDLIYEKMLSADVVVLSTPVYFFSMSAQLKTMIDRLRPIYRRMTGKPFCLIATVSVDEPEKLDSTFDAMRGLLRCIPESVELGAIYGNSAWLPGDIRNTQAMNEAYQLGLSL